MTTFPDKILRSIFHTEVGRINKFRSTVLHSRFWQEQVWLLWNPLNVKNNWTTALFRNQISAKSPNQGLGIYDSFLILDFTKVKFLFYHNWECSIVERNLLNPPCLVLYEIHWKQEFFQIKLGIFLETFGRKKGSDLPLTDLKGHHAISQVQVYSKKYSIDWTARAPACLWQCASSSKPG